MTTRRRSSGARPGRPAQRLKLGKIQTALLGRIDPAPTKGVTLDFSRPGKPTDNAYIEAFNGRFRAECLNAHWFLTLADAVEKLEHWRRYYNEVRPHGAIGHKPPISLLNHDGAASPPP